MKKLLLIGMLLLCAVNVFARDVTVSVTAGENWKGKHTPQFAIWLEDTEGNYITTLYVTEKASRKSWIFCPKEGRPESLPVWYHASKQDVRKGKEAQKANARLQLDAVTGATPTAGISFTQNITDSPCVIKAEFNVSFDYNDVYTKANSNDNGQPSVVYEAKIDGAVDGPIELAFSGTGSIAGTDGEIHTDAQGLETALSIVKSVTVQTGR